MAVNDSLLMTSRLSSIKAVEDALNFMPDNPLRDPFAGVWMYMTNNFTKFQIATFGSFIVHEVCISLCPYHFCISVGISIKELGGQTPSPSPPLSITVPSPPFPFLFSPFPHSPRFQAFSFLCTFVPGSEKSIERTFAPVELSFHGTFAPWNFCSCGTFVPRERRFQELSFRGTFAPVELSFLGSERSKNFRSYETVVS